MLLRIFRSIQTIKYISNCSPADFSYSLRPSKPEEHKKDIIKQPIQKRRNRLAVSKKLSKKPAKANKPSEKLCDICGVFKSPDKLSTHKKNRHFSVESKCPQCPHKFSSEQNLRRHQQRVHNGKPFVCETCGKGFSLKGLLTTHIKVVHLKIIKKKRLSCDKCDRTFCNKKSLIVHDRSAHTGKKLFNHFNYYRVTHSALICPLVNIPPQTKGPYTSPCLQADW